jgi:pyruvate ferredoxin oxidoreductase gamma subunit
VFQIRIHGRGGQGVVTAAELLSVAAFDSDHHSQAFPSFGSERTGAPVTAFCRIDQRPIRTREPISEPDALIIQDPTLLHQVDVFGGLRPSGKVLINTTRTIEALGLGELGERPEPPTVLTVPGTELAREHLGRALPNAALLGGFAALAGVVTIEGVELAINERFSGAVAAGNVGAARAAHDFVREKIGATAGA